MATDSKHDRSAPGSDPGDPSAVEIRSDSGLVLVASAWGDADRTPVLFLHGGGQTRHAWSRTARTIAARGYRALTLDLRGHGDSDHAVEPDYRLDDFVGDLRAVIGWLGRPPVLVGASLGGLVSLLLHEPTHALSGRTTSLALILVDIAPRVENAGVARILEFMRTHRDGFDTLEQAADAVAAYLPRRPRPRSLDGLKKNLRRTADGRYRWHWDPRLLDSFSRDDMLDNARLLAAARAATVPILLVRGVMSDVVSQAVVDEFLAAVPHAEHLDVSDAGHMVAGDSNDVFTDAVIDFLARVTPGENA